MPRSARRSPLVEVRHSQVHGYGVFALRRIRKGTTVMEYVGERVSHAEADARYEHKDARDNHTFLFTVDSRTVIDGGVDGNDARYINHGCDPNCESTTRDRRVFIEAIRTIEPGEELCYDYQIQRDDDDPADVDEIFACRCGATGCRGSMLEPRKPVRAKKKRVIRAAGSRSRVATGASKRRAAPAKAHQGAARKGGQGAAKGGRAAKKGGRAAKKGGRKPRR